MKSIYNVFSKKPRGAPRPPNRLSDSNDHRSSHDDKMINQTPTIEPPVREEPDQEFPAVIDQQNASSHGNTPDDLG